MEIMHQELVERVKAEAEYIIENKTTIRLAAKKFKISKSTLHKDVTKRLYCIDEALYRKVRRVLDYNISQRAIRGGMATKKKYESNPKNSR